MSQPGNPSVVTAGLAAHGARRLLILGGIALILAGMVFGDIFAVFVLHQNAARIGENMQMATKAAAEGDADLAVRHFVRIGHWLENRGTKVDTHVHVIVFGYLALLLALLQPWVAFSAARQRQLALLFLAGAVLLPLSVFLIPYVGLAHSPLGSIGWASLFADFGGLLVIVACAGELAGLSRHLRGGSGALEKPAPARALLAERSWASRALLCGGTLLVLGGFLHGAYYAAVHRQEHETRDLTLLREIVGRAAAGDFSRASAGVELYGALQAEKAVHIAAHAHVIEFGILAMLLAFIQPWIFLSDRWKNRWVVALLAGSVTLPVFVLLETRWGLLAGGIADAGGLLVIVALTGMLVGVLRYTGRVDAA